MTGFDRLLVRDKKGFCSVFVRSWFGSASVKWYFYRTTTEENPNETKKLTKESNPNKGSKNKKSDPNWIAYF
jgi:hypothetical protein